MPPSRMARGTNSSDARTQTEWPKRADARHNQAKTANCLYTRSSPETAAISDHIFTQMGYDQTLRSDRGTDSCPHPTLDWPSIRAKRFIATRKLTGQPQDN